MGNHGQRGLKGIDIQVIDEEMMSFDSWFFESNLSFFVTSIFSYSQLKSRNVNFEQG